MLTVERRAEEGCLLNDPVAGPCFARADLPDGRRAWVIPQITNAALIVGPPDGLAYDDRW